jgi:hypothetical protein
LDWQSLSSILWPGFLVFARDVVLSSSCTQLCDSWRWSAGRRPAESDETSFEDTHVQKKDLTPCEEVRLKDAAMAGTGLGPIFCLVISRRRNAAWAVCTSEGTLTGGASDFVNIYQRCALSLPLLDLAEEVLHRDLALGAEVGVGKLFGLVTGLEDRFFLLLGRNRLKFRSLASVAGDQFHLLAGH